MKFIVTFKTPDALDGPTEEFGNEQAQLRSSVNENYNDEELELMTDEWKEKAKKFAEKFVKYGEYIRVEFDMVAGTAKVLEAR